MENFEQKFQRVTDDEIDLADLLRQVWAGRWIIVITTIVFIAMAVLYLLYNNYSGVKEYESQATLFVESPSPDSLITVTKSPLFISEVLKIKLEGLGPGAALTVAELLDQQTKPPQGNLAGLTSRINATKGNAGVLVIAVKMQDQSTARQLADSVIQKLTQFLKESQLKRAEKKQLILTGDTSINFKYLSLSSSKDLQLLSEVCQRAEAKYFQALRVLSDFYRHNSKNLESIDSIEIKRLNADIKMKLDLYSTLYQKLDQAKLEAVKQFEQKKIDANKQLEQVTIDAVKKAPVLNVLEPATAATELNVPKTKKVLLLMVFFGIIVGVGIVFGKKFWEKNFKEKS